MTFATRSGAVTADAVVLHYGNLFVEARALESGGVVARGDLAVLALTGSERLSWLDTLTSQALAALQPGESAETLILDPHGHIEHALHLVDDGETCWAVLPAERAEAALGWLNRMRFRADVQIRDVSDEYFVLAQHGEIAVDLAAHGWPALHDPWPGVGAGGFGYAESAAAWAATEWIVPRSAEAALSTDLDAAGVPVAGLLAWQALRIAAGRPEASDADEKSLPHEFDWLRTAVHLNKGCYRGQETVAKVHNLGRPPRRLVLLHLDGSDSALPEPGDAVWAMKRETRSLSGGEAGVEMQREGVSTALNDQGTPREVGQIVLAAQHWELGPIALALVKRAMPASEPVTVAHGELQIAASQQELVPAEAGPALNIPRFPRMGIRP